MIAQGKRDLIADLWKKQLRTGKVKPTESRTYSTLFAPSKVGKAGLNKSKPTTGRIHR